MDWLRMWWGGRRSRMKGKRENKNITHVSCFCTYMYIFRISTLIDRLKQTIIANIVCGDKKVKLNFQKKKTEQIKNTHRNTCGKYRLNSN